MPDAVQAATERDPVEQTLEAYRIAFATPHGHRILEDLELSFGGITYAGEATHESAFREGQRSVLLHIQAILKGDAHA